MSKVKTVVLACIAILAGIVIGGLLAGYASIRTIKFIGASNGTRIYTSAVQDIMFLDQLWHGDAQSPIESLEVQLDGDLVSLWMCHWDSPADRRDPLLNLLAKVQDYRTKNPHKTGRSGVDQSTHRGDLGVGAMRVTDRSDIAYTKRSRMSLADVRRSTPLRLPSHPPTITV